MLRQKLDTRGLTAWRSEMDAVSTRERRPLFEAARLSADSHRSVRMHMKRDG